MMSWVAFALFLHWTIARVRCTGQAIGLIESYFRLVQHTLLKQQA
jgi:hypothetical protein